MKLGLETIERLTERLGRPERLFPSVHIAGTNGKGSTAAMLESVLRHAGYKTGLYTSPHLVDMRERIRINGRPLSEEKFSAYAERLQPHINAVGASFFETLTAMAFLCFAEEKIDIAVLETGLGGRLDATNIVKPVLTMITEIGLEHTKILGNTIASIAAEKAGILKTGVPLVCGASSPKAGLLFSMDASRKNVPLIRSADAVRISSVRLAKEGSRFHAKTGAADYPDLFLRLAGRHQIENARLDLASMEVLKKLGWNLPERAVRLGFENVVWRARLELLHTDPDVLVDAAHNPLGIRTLVQALKTLYHHKRMILVFGVLHDKNYRNMLERIAPLADTVILTAPKSERALEPQIMASLLCLKGKTVRVIPDIETAWMTAIRELKPGDLVCGTGSIYLIGEVLRLSA